MGAAGAFADDRNSTRSPGYALVGLHGSARLTGAVSVFADARNLTGERGIADVSAVVQAGAQSGIYYPVEGRAVFAGVRAGF